MIREIAQTFRGLRGVPDLVAFWLDAWVIRVEDRRRLSPYVYDAWWWLGEEKLRRA